jgi:hypothetical protein
MFGKIKLNITAIRIMMLSITTVIRTTLPERNSTKRLNPDIPIMQSVILPSVIRLNAAPPLKMALSDKFRCC